MTFYARVGSPLGPILLSSDGTHLDGLYFMDQTDCPPVEGAAPSARAKPDPTSGTLSGLAIKDFKIHKTVAATPDLFDDPDADGDGRQAQASRCGEGGCAIPADHLRQTAILPGAAASEPLTLMQADTPERVQAVFDQTWHQLQEYFKGKRKGFTVPLHLNGTPFQKKVWEALLEIPYGEYVSYGDIARAAGLTPGHGRPVGTAVGRNPITIIVPCHRVLAGNGKLNGYTGGLERKLALLEIEGFTLR